MNDVEDLKLENGDISKWKKAIDDYVNWAEVLTTVSTNSANTLSISNNINNTVTSVDLNNIPNNYGYNSASNGIFKTLENDYWSTGFSQVDWKEVDWVDWAPKITEEQLEDANKNSFITLEKAPENFNLNGCSVLGKIDDIGILPFLRQCKFSGNEDAWLSSFWGTVTKDGLVLVSPDIDSIYFEDPSMIIDVLVESGNKLKDSSTDLKIYSD